ncbi:MAG: ribosome maturation factor RimM [Rhizobiales bacterium]|nr:ribosome maturation factor RimM [Hyphomicrobiales bacterium]
MASGSDRHVVLGIITSAHGICGEVKLKSFTEDPEAIAGYGPLATKAGGSLEIQSLKPSKNGFIARIKGVSDRNQAEALRGTELRVERDKLPEPGNEEFYYADLVGLNAETPDGQGYGKVTAVHDFGAGDLLEIQLTGTSKTELIAFTAETVPAIEIANGRIIVVPPVEDEEEDK